MFNRKEISVIGIVILGAFFFFLFFPVSFGVCFFILFLMTFLGMFEFQKWQKSIYQISLFFLVCGILFSPVLGILFLNEYRISHPEIIFSGINSKEIFELTEKFKETYFFEKRKIDEKFLRDLEMFVYERLPYDWNPVRPFPVLKEVLKKRKSDCRGRALLGYAILRNLGIKSKIAYSFMGHAWLRIDDKKGFKEAFRVEGEYPLWVLLSEKESKKESSLKVILIFLKNGIYFPKYIDSALPSPLNEISKKIKNLLGFGLIELTAGFPFFLPLAVGILFLFFQRKKKNFFQVIFFLVCGGVLVCLTGGIEISLWQKLSPLPITILCGFYLRVINFLIKKS